jgi:hypothetical protein
MLGTIVGARLIDDRVNLRRLNWLLRAVHEISAYRNIAAHLSIEFRERGGKPSLEHAIDGVRRASALKRLLVDFHETQFWEQLAGDLYALTQYAEWLATHILYPNLRGPLPYKPRLLSLPTIREANKQADQWLQRPGRQRGGEHRGRNPDPLALYQPSRTI